MLTHISIENFKGIRDRVEIELKPITLLFGPNSAGKSTILHALLYAQEVFERHNLNADTTAAGGPFINFGGFSQMVHGHNLDRPILLGFRFKLDGGDFEPYEHDVDAFEVVLRAKAEQIIDRPRSAAVFVTIRWSKHLGPPRPVVESCLFQLDGRDFAEITFDDVSHQRRLKLLTLDHPLFRRAEHRTDGDLSTGDQSSRGPFWQPIDKGPDLLHVVGEDPLAYSERNSVKAPSIFHLALVAIEEEMGSIFRGAADEGLLLPSRKQDDALPRLDASVGPVDTLYGRRARNQSGRRIKEWLHVKMTRAGHPNTEDVEVAKGQSTPP